MKPNQKELSALVQRDLSQPDDVRLAAQSLIQSGKVRRVVVSGSAGALGVDASGSVQVVPPPMKSQSTVGAGDSMVGAMTCVWRKTPALKTWYALASPPVAPRPSTGTRLCSRANTQKSMIISAGVDLPGPSAQAGINISRMVYAGKAMHNNGV